MNIGIDMMGGEFAPLEAVLGIKHLRQTSLPAEGRAQGIRHKPAEGRSK